jgi:hypothetical protein
LKLADYSDVVTVQQLDAALRAGGFQGVFHYLAGNNARRIEDPAVVAGIRDRGWPQAGISVPTVNAVDGAADARRTREVYRFGDGFQLYLDIEPAEFDADPVRWPAAANRWCDAVRAARLSPGVYGVDRTVSACSDHADRIWRAKPGLCDPAGPGLAPSFFAGRRAVQCDAGKFPDAPGGVVMDVSFSQFDLSATGGDLEMAGFADTTLGQKLDQLANVLLAGFDSRVPNPAIFATLAAIKGDESGLLAAMQASQQTLAAAQAAVAAVQSELEVVHGAIQGSAGGAVDLSRLYQELAALGRHLGVDVTTGTDT